MAERFLLTEKTKQFLLEIDGETSLEKAKRDPNIPIYLVGIIQSGDKPNRNLRLYPWDVLKKECERYAEEEISEQRSFGELDHPEDSATPSLKNASHTIEDLWFDDEKKDVWAKFKLLNAYAPPNDPAMKARSILLNGKALGSSSRALGSLSEGYGEYDIVEEDLEIVCWDLVSNASNYGSEKLRVSEQKGKNKVNSNTERSHKTLLTESQCLGGDCSIQNSRNIINEAKFQELTEQEKTYLNILGVEKFLQIKRKYHLSK